MKMFLGMCLNRGIGFRNHLPCHLKAVRELFHKKTIGKGNNAVIMGRTTYLQFPKLINRTPLVLTKRIGDNGNFFKKIEDVYKHLDNHNYDDIWIIGGETVFKSFLEEPKLEEIHIVELQHDFMSDKFFPEIPKLFQLVSISPCEKENNIKYRYTEYEKRYHPFYARYSLRNRFTIPRYSDFLR